MNHTLIGRYYGGKMGLLLEVFKAAVRKSNENGLSYPPQNSLQRELKAYIEHKIDGFEKNHSFFRILLTQVLTDNKFKKLFQKYSADSSLKSIIDRLDHIQLLNKEYKLVLPTPDILHLIELQALGSFIVSTVIFDLGKDSMKKSLENLIELLIIKNEPV